VVAAADLGYRILVSQSNVATPDSQKSLKFFASNANLLLGKDPHNAVAIPGVEHKARQ
jgi:hypothetical protein